MDNPFKSPAILSLCTGMRGLERGVERAIGPVRTIAYVEIEAFIVENLVRQMEQGVLAPAPVWSNVKTFPSSLFRDRVHGITGGYPCQPFSYAGRRDGADDPRHLWPHIRRMVGSINPVWCFFENVAGHLTLGYQQVRQDLQQLGYTVKEGIFSAEEVGAPHQRKRLFILAILADANNGYTSGTSRKNAEKNEGSGVQERHEDKEFGKSNGMANANEFNGRQQQQFESGNGEGTWDQSSRGSALADTFGEWKQQQGWSLKKSRGRTQHCSKSQSLADCIGQRLEIVRESSTRKEQQTFERGSSVDRWPSPSGRPQHDWESPRIESLLGYRTHGYNFREDLLRMAGNAVVEQTAEIAFRTLLKKFYA